MRKASLAAVIVAAPALVLATMAPTGASVPWSWPVVGPVVRGFDPPDSPYGAGHRGIDIAAPVGTTVTAPDDGVVSFAGPVGGKLFLTIDHGGGVTSTASWLTSLLVHKGDQVVRGQPVATTGWGHPDLTLPQLHLSVRLDGTYVDPLAYLGPLAVSSFIRLAPLVDGTGTTMAAGRMSALAYPIAPVALHHDGRAVGRGARVGTGRGRNVATVPGRPRPHRRRPSGTGTAIRGRVEPGRGHR